MVIKLQPFENAIKILESGVVTKLQLFENAICLGEMQEKILAIFQIVCLCLFHELDQAYYWM